MRQLINRSIPLKTYHPQDTDAWDAAYIHFKNCIR
jgi:rhamnulokinase